MPVTLIVEPDPGGHRFQAVAHVAALAGRSTDVVLITTEGARERDEFANFLASLPLEVEERFAGSHPPTREMAAAIAEQARRRDVAQALVMDADQSLKRWWYLAWREFRGLGHRRPRVIFMLTRYPARLRLTDRFGWLLRTSKATLALLAMATGTLHRVAGFAGREDLSTGWLVKRARDPAICTAHSRDRAKLRADLGLPGQRPIVGIFGVIGARKNAPFVLDAIEASGVDADLLLGGKVRDDSAQWLASLPAERRARVLVDDGFHPDAHLDQLVAASDVAAIALTNNGPSGIMGKALAAGVPVVTAGSHVRATELQSTGGGVACELTVESFGAALRRVLTGEWTMQADTTPPATGEAFAAALLGVDA
jgi:hypothetical protein